MFTQLNPEPNFYFMVKNTKHNWCFLRKASLSIKPKDLNILIYEVIMNK